MRPARACACPHTAEWGWNSRSRVRLKRDLVPEGGVPSLVEVAAAVDAVAPAIEIVDDRRADYRALDALSLIADNAWNAGIVLGDFVQAWPELASIEG